MYFSYYQDFFDSLFSFTLCHEAACIHDSASFAMLPIILPFILPVSARL